MDKARYFNYHRRQSSVVNIGQTPLGGDYPIRLQSMTTTATADIEASVGQCACIAKAGADYVRLTAQGHREAEALRHIRQKLNEAGVTTPLVADIHFNPAVADAAAQVVEKVRINPGNYVDSARTFKHLEFTDEAYAAELEKIRARLLPFLAICRSHNTAIRIGVNHGSLSDRIMSRYGDTPEGIVESCMEFLRICKSEQFHDVVLSIKASNTRVMVRSVRLLVAQMEKEGMAYPLHLGVTEAGAGEDGRIKSAVGIGALLADGLGDTIRVSLSEAPECEIPVAAHLRDHVAQAATAAPVEAELAPTFNYEHPERRLTTPVGGFGGTQVPQVIAIDASADYIYCPTAMPSANERDNGKGYIVPADIWEPATGVFPYFTTDNLTALPNCDAPIKFLALTYTALTPDVVQLLSAHPETVVVALATEGNLTGSARALAHGLMHAQLQNPLVLHAAYAHSATTIGDFQLEAAADLGALLFDGFCDGLFLENHTPNGAQPITDADIARTAFSILQSAGLRRTRVDYVSCPGCGRTLYDLPATIARIKAATQGLRPLSIAVMGCIVNGPGEMADADYGYVGAARGKISLYRGKTCVERNIPEEDAVEHLMQLLKADGMMD